jgi:hypothetical protein
MALRRTTTLVGGTALLLLGLAGTASASTHAGYAARCTGDTLRVQVDVSGVARLLAGHDQGHLTPTGRTEVVPSSGQVTFDLGGLGARHYRVDVTDAKGAVLGRSNAVPAASCAPGHEVPEVPVAALAPGSLLLTGGVLLARRRRASSAR